MSLRLYYRYLLNAALSVPPLLPTALASILYVHGELSILGRFARAFTDSISTPHGNLCYTVVASVVDGVLPGTHRFDV
jgi:hypothetical protein